MMKDLVRVQLYETALWKWLLLLCLVFGAINISLTSYLSAEFSNAPAYEDLLIQAANDSILVSYTYTLLLPVLIGYAGIPTSWQAQLCMRSGSRRSWLFSMVISMMIKVALYIAMICISVLMQILLFFFRMSLLKRLPTTTQFLHFAKARFIGILGFISATLFSIGLYAVR